MFPIDIRLKKCVKELFSKTLLCYKDPFMLIYCPDRYKTQKMCDKAVDDCLAAVKFIPDWFVTSKMLKKFDNTSLANGDIVL